MTFTPPTADQDADELLQKTVNAIPILDHTDADVRDAARVRLMQDIAFEIYPAAELAVRYGLGTVAGLRIWLTRNPEMMRQIKVMRALHQSDTGIQERNRLKANHAVEQAIPSITGVVLDPTKGLELRLKAFASLQKMAGLDGAPPPDKTAAVGVQTNIVIQHGSGKATTIMSTTVVPETIEALPVVADDGDYEEDA